MNTADVIDFIHGFSLADAPDHAVERSQLNLLDLCGVGLGGALTSLSAIIRTHAKREFGGAVPMLFDGGTASASGAALAGGMTIDALDGHDGFNSAKGHVGCALMPAVFAIAHSAGIDDGKKIVEAVIAGYELGSRLGPSLHASVPDYHTSGAWMAVAVAGVGARMLGLSPSQTAHALGIAEYHGPRSQMMRCIDHPTMVKDGSGWGAMTGVSAVFLAQDGFTGAPALTIGAPDALWHDLGQRWLVAEQYMKPYPVCRWAQPPAEAILKLKHDHGLASQDVDRIVITTFHESTRLASDTPANTEEAQYSTSFPCAVALVRDDVTPADLMGDALHDPEVLRLSQAMEMREDDHANACFPARRIARVTLHLKDGRALDSDWHDAKWDPTNPATRDELCVKFRKLATPALGADSEMLENAILSLASGGTLSAATRHLYRPVQPISPATT